MRIIERMLGGAVALALLLAPAGEGALAQSAGKAKETTQVGTKYGAKTCGKTAAKTTAKTSVKNSPSAKPGKSAKPVPRARPAHAPPPVDACTACFNALDAKVAACRATLSPEVKPRYPPRFSASERKAETARKVAFNGCLKIADDGVAECNKAAHCNR